MRRGVFPSNHCKIVLTWRYMIGAKRVGKERKRRCVCVIAAG